MTTCIFQYIEAHPGVSTLLGGGFITAFASTIPEKFPRSLDEWWGWFRSFTQQISSVVHPRPKESL